MVFPAIETRALPGNREDAYRAGITPRIRCGTIEYSTTAVWPASVGVLDLLADERVEPNDDRLFFRCTNTRRRVQPGTEAPPFLRECFLHWKNCLAELAFWMQ